MSQTYQLLVLGSPLLDDASYLLQQHLTAQVQFETVDTLPLYHSKVQAQGLRLSLKTNLSKTALTQSCDAFSQRYQLDVLLWEDALVVPKLAVFDMDSTLIATEVIDELAMQAGIGEQVQSITEQAMRGELDFNQSFRQRMSLLKGLNVQVLEDILHNLPLMQGATELFAQLKEQGCYSAILSGGFTYFAEHLQRLLHIDEVHANRLDCKHDQLSGEVLEPIINAQAKAQILTELRQKLNLDPAQTMAVGDGANDLLMLAQAGLGVAFHAKPKVQQQAEFKLNYNGLDALGYVYAK